MFSIKYPDWYKKNRKRFWSNITDEKWNDWNWQISNQIRRVEELSVFLPDIAPTLLKKAEALKIGITPYFLSLIDLKKTNDPIKKQIIPSEKEYKLNPKLHIDPFNEKKTMPAPHLIKRYKDRVVITATNICASYCRYCTRKWMWESPVKLGEDKLDKITNYLNKKKNIREVIISGGDPLLLSLSKLENIIKKIHKIKHIEVIRIATRLPAFLPQKIDNNMVEMLSKYRPIWIVTHFNHPNEITPASKKAIDLLLKAKLPICNQSVLLKKVNNNYETLRTLFCTLQCIGIKPYYLFQCDPVAGTLHFKTSIKKGSKIMNKLYKNIGGIAVPTYIVDTEKYGKIPVPLEIVKKM